MFTKEIFRFLLKVVSSWQVIAVTIVLILYFSLVSYVAKLYHPRPEFSFDSKAPRAKKQKNEAPPEELDAGGGDDLGLEEE
ncbi:MAG: hypothetical protein LBB82_02880 [Treponema sp.]|jgi:hypothetical protein|nr:hypothetical protein [Treponema sp.]